MGDKMRAVPVHDSLAAPANAVDEVRIFWLVVLHVTFVGSGLLFALMDWVASLEKKGH